MRTELAQKSSIPVITTRVPMNYRDQYREHVSQFWKRIGPFGVLLPLRVYEWLTVGPRFSFACSYCHIFIPSTLKWTCPCGHRNGCESLLGIGWQRNTFLDCCAKCGGRSDSIRCPNRACNRTILVDDGCTAGGTAIIHSDFNLIDDACELLAEVAKAAVPVIALGAQFVAERFHTEIKRELTLEEIRFKTRVAEELGKLAEATRTRRTARRGESESNTRSHVKEQELERELAARMAVEEAGTSVLRKMRERYKDDPIKLKKIQAWIAEWQVNHIQ
jgi:hypothetical protein